MDIMLDNFMENLEKIQKQYESQKREIEELRKKLREYCTITRSYKCPVLRFREIKNS